MSCLIIYFFTTFDTQINSIQNMRRKHFFFVPFHHTKCFEKKNSDILLYKYNYSINPYIFVNVSYFVLFGLVWGFTFLVIILLNHFSYFNIVFGSRIILLLSRRKRRRRKEKTFSTHLHIKRILSIRGEVQILIL